MPHQRLLPLIVASFIAISLVGTAAAQEPLWAYATGTGGVSGVSLSSNGSVVAAASDRIYAFSAAGDKLWAGSRGVAVQLSSDGSTLASGGDDGVRLFGARTGAVHWHDSSWTYVNHLAMTPDGRYVLSGAGSALALFSANGTIVWKNVSATPRSLAVSADASYAAFARKGALEVYNRNGRRVWTDSLGGEMNAVAISGDPVFIAGNDENKVILWSKTGARLWAAGTGNTVSTIAVSKDASYVVAGGRDSAVHCYNRTGAELWSYSAGGWIGCVAVSDDGSRVAAGSFDRYVYLFDRQGTLLWRSMTPSIVESIALSADGRYLAAGSNDGTLLLFSTSVATAGPAAGSPTDAPPIPIYSEIQTPSPAGTVRPTGGSAETAKGAATAAPTASGSSMPLLLPCAAGIALAIVGKRRH